MAVQNSSGLASLTATYTDSEGEDEPGHHSSPSPDKPTPDRVSIGSPVPAPTAAQNTKRLAQLVSYHHDDHDDNVISDEEGGASLGTSVDKAKTNELVEDAGESLDSSVRLPPEPLGHCSITLQEKIARLYDKMRLTGLDMNGVIQGRKDFRNPSIYEKLIQFCSINEFGTNYPPQVYDPLQWGAESYYEELANAQKLEMERRLKERKDHKEKAKVEFVSGTAKRSGGSNPGSGAEDDLKRRKSKWDQVGGTVGSGITAPSVFRPVGLMQQPSLTSNATGTKGTVISAFGSLPKKPKV